MHTHTHTKLQIVNSIFNKKNVCKLAYIYAINYYFRHHSVKNVCHAIMQYILVMNYKLILKLLFTILLPSQSASVTAKGQKKSFTDLTTY